MKKFYFLFFLLILIYNSTSAQFGYYYSRFVTLPDTEVTAGSTPFFVPYNKEDVKAIGMGKTQVANGRKFNAMMYNPALLAKRKTSIDGINIQASLPPKSYDAAFFLKDHIREFKEALSLKAVWRGVKDFKAAQTLEEQLAALREIQNGIKFPRDLLNEVIGSSSDPMIHGIRMLPSIAIQTGNFGLSIYGIGQSGFQVQQSPIVDALLDIKIPDNINDQNQILNAIYSLEGILSSIVNIDESIADEALPVAYSFSYIDVVGAAGYGFKVSRNVSLGANLKVLHRRFSAKRIHVTGYDNVLSEAFNDLKNHITGFTFDVGTHYRSDWGTEMGLSLQNIIPIQKITSTMEADFIVSENYYDTDNFGNVIVNNMGDTAIANYTRTINIRLPFDLKVPFIMNLGFLHPINKYCDVAFDWVDLIEQDSQYDNTFDRIRLGSEYRFEISKDKFEVVPRLGLSDSHPTFGLGLNIFRALQLDGAYAFDSFIDDFSYFVQIKIGW